MKKVGCQEFQEYSEIDLFNKIGFMLGTLGFKPVYFKVLHPKFIETENGFEFDYKYMHYMHLYKNEDMKISIYYDEYNIGAMFPEEPYYELYDRCDTERFLDTDEDRRNLFNKVKGLIG